MHRSVSNAPLLFANMGQVKRIRMWDQTCPEQAESDRSTHAQSIMLAFALHSYILYSMDVQAAFACLQMPKYMFLYGTAHI